MSNPYMILGNGQSRKQINLKQIDNPIIGCNAVVRDHPVDHLICVDRKMVREAMELGHPCIYTRKEWSSQFTTVNSVPPLPYKGTERHDDPFHWGSGPYAVLLGCTLTDELHLLGFDLFGDNGKINNVYKGTNNYNSADYRAINPRYWIAQIGRLFDLYKDKTFVIHQPSDWILPDTWNLPNVSLDFRTYFV